MPAAPIWCIGVGTVVETLSPSATAASATATVGNGDDKEDDEEEEEKASNKSCSSSVAAVVTGDYGNDSDVLVDMETVDTLLFLRSAATRGTHVQQQQHQWQNQPPNDSDNNYTTIHPGAAIAQQQQERCATTNQFALTSSAGGDDNDEDNNNNNHSNHDDGDIDDNDDMDISESIDGDYAGHPSPYHTTLQQPGKTRDDSLDSLSPLGLGTPTSYRHTMMNRHPSGAESRRQTPRKQYYTLLSNYKQQDCHHQQEQQPHCGYELKNNHGGNRLPHGYTVQDWESFPLDEHDAHQELERIFAGKDWPQETEYIVDVLKTWPNLCQETFVSNRTNHGHLLPFTHFLLEADGNIEPSDIIDVYKLYPVVLQQAQGRFQSLPLHFICHYVDIDEKANSKIAEFMIKEYPGALVCPNAQDMLPIHCLLAKQLLGENEHRASFSSIMMLMKAEASICPVKMDAKQRMQCLLFAIFGGYDLFVLRYLWRLQPVTEFRLPGEFLNKPVVLDDRLVSILEDLLHRKGKGILRLKCRSRVWEVKALHYFLKCMQNNPSLSNLMLHIPPSKLGSDGRRILQQALADNTNLRELVLGSNPALDNDATTADDNTSMLNALRLGLEVNQTLSRLKLTRSKGLMLDLVVNGKTSLQEVVVIYGRFLDVPIDWKPKNLQSCQMQSLQLYSCSINGHTLLALLKQLVHLPFLRELKMGDLSRLHPDITFGGPDYDLTEPLVALLRLGRLKRLQVGFMDFPVQADAILDELRSNSSLTCLGVHDLFREDRTTLEAKLVDVLRVHNTSLVNVSVGSENDKIVYYLRLNIFGRTQARDEATTRAEYVELLCSIARARGAKPGQDWHSIVFGILRESPNQWSLEADGSECVSPSSRKRRRRQSDDNKADDWNGGVDTLSETWIDQVDPESSIDTWY